jgi:hypothetical protein
METMPNITSLLPLLRQNVDGALLLESMDKLLKGDRSNKGIMTVHDAFYGSVQELDKLKQEYDKLSIELAKGYDDAGVMAAAAKYVVKQLEKAQTEGKNVGKNQLQIARALAKNIDTQYKKNVVAKSRLGKMSISVLGVSEYEQAPAKVESTEVKVEKKAPVKKVVAKKTKNIDDDILHILDTDTTPLRKLRDSVAEKGKLTVSIVKEFIQDMAYGREETEILDTLDAISDGKVEFVDKKTAEKMTGKKFTNGATIQKDGNTYIYVDYKKATEKSTLQNMNELANVLYHEIEHARTKDWIKANEKSPIVKSLKSGLDTIVDKAKESTNKRLQYVAREHAKGDLGGVDELVAAYREENIYGRRDLVKDISKLVGEAKSKNMEVSIKKIMKQVARSLQGKKMEGLNEIELDTAQIIASIEYISQANSKQDTGKIRVQKLYEQLKKECKG